MILVQSNAADLGVLGAETHARDLKMGSSQVSRISTMATAEMLERIMGIARRDSGDFPPLLSKRE